MIHTNNAFNEKLPSLFHAYAGMTYVTCIYTYNNRHNYTHLYTIILNKYTNDAYLFDTYTYTHTQG
jgi:hypothetical protein